ncbi:MAG: hypothetical protein ACYC5Y_15280 [Symbiobacteriia bacterium]
MRHWYTDGARSALRLALECEGFAPSPPLDGTPDPQADLMGQFEDAPADRPEALLPAYLCDTLLAPFHHHGLAVRFYDVRPDLTIDLEDIRRRLGPQTRVLLFIHYFGFLQPRPVLDFLQDLQLQAAPLAIIEDQTHAVWTLARPGDAAAGNTVAAPMVGQYAIASYRKFGKPFDGGYLALADPGREVQAAPPLAPWVSPAHCLSALAWGLEQQSSAGARERGLARKLWEEAEVQYDRDRLARAMAPGARRVLANLNIPALVTRRRRAYRQTLAALSQCPHGEPLRPVLPADVCPLTVPVLANSPEERGPLRAWLTRHGLESVLLWPLAPGADPAEFPGAATAASRLVQVLLPLPREENRAL